MPPVLMDCKKRCVSGGAASPSRSGRNHIHHLGRKQLGTHGRLEVLVQALKRELIESLERGSNVSFREARMAGEGRNRQSPRPLSRLVSCRLARLAARALRALQPRYRLVMVEAIEQLRAGRGGDRGRLLAVPAGSALLQVDRVALDINQVPVEWRMSRSGTRRHHYLNRPC
jgi:hypothetical protein